MSEDKRIEGFDDFWKAYPRKRDKIAAIKAYKRAQKIATSAEILRAAKLYAEERAGKEDRYTQYPATWLNAGGFQNYPPQTEAPTPTGFYASFTSDELVAWDQYRIDTEGRDYPKDKKGGWWFPTRWPPGYEQSQAA